MIRAIAIGIVLLCYYGAAEAYGSLRCQGKIIRPGTTMAQVLSLCGAPKNRIVEEVPVRSRVASGFSRFAGISYTETWEYDRGWGKFPALLIFQDGRIRRIEYLPYRSGAL